MKLIKNKHTEGNVTTITFVENANLAIGHGVEPLLKTLQGYADGSDKNKGRVLVLDMGNVEFIARDFITELHRLAINLKSQGGDLQIGSPNLKIYAALIGEGLDKVRISITPGTQVDAVTGHASAEQKFPGKSRGH